jgi:NAD(P) transhydrogenase
VSERFDLVVIGAGPAGEKAATQASYFGKRVAIVERKPNPGGIAVSDAGIPTKTLREAAQYLTGFRHRDIYGIGISLDARLKLQAVMARTAEVVGVMTEAVKANLSRANVELVHGRARLGANHQVVVTTDGGERILDAHRILIATGSRPVRPASIPFSDPGVFDSEGILKLDKLPRSLVVVGGGAVGVEYASIFTALGVEVTLVEGTAALMAFADTEVSHLLAEIFRTQGMRVVLGHAITSIARSDGKLHVALDNGDTLAPDHVLFAGGRIGNTEDLGLAEAGVAIDEKGRIRVDDTYATTAKGIYAAGDVIGPPALASVSQEQGRVAACHAFDLPFKDFVDPLPPFGVYSLPELAMVGLTEQAAKARGIDYEVGRGWFKRNTRARISGATDGVVKLVFRRADRVLLGVHIIADVASELIHVGQIIVSLGKPIDYFIHCTFNVPTFSEAYKYAAYDGLQRLEQSARQAKASVA